MTLWTATDAAKCAAEALHDQVARRSGAFRCLLQLLDDYGRAVRDGGPSAGAALFQGAPPAAGDSGVDAAIAALCEHLARRDGWRPPSWVFDDRRYAEPWWFVSGVRAWHAIALVESPLAFRKRGVFLTSSALERGGAAMTLAYDTRRATRDVDAIFEPKQTVYEAARRVADSHGLPEDWLTAVLAGDEAPGRP